MPGFPHQLKVEIAFAGNALAQSPTWVDVSDTVMALDVTRGRSTFTDTAQPGTLGLTLDNSDSRYDPLNSTGPHYGNIRPNRPIRVTAQHTSSSPVVGLFYGHIDTWAQTWPGGGSMSVTTVSATDLSKILARRAFTLTTPAASASQRIRDILDGTSTSFRDAINLPGHASRTLVGKRYEGENLLEALQEAAQSDGGPLFLDGSGFLTFQTDAYRTTSARSTGSQGTFGNAAGAVEVESDLEPIVDDLGMANVVTITDGNGLTQSYSDGASVDRDGRLELDLGSTLLFQSSAEERANAVLIRRLNADPRVESLTLDALTGDQQMAHALNRQISDRITLSVAPQGGGSAWSLDLFIESISHSIAVGSAAQWQTTFELSPA